MLQTLQMCFCDLLPVCEDCCLSLASRQLPADRDAAAAQVRWEPAENGGRPSLVEVPNTTEVLEADLVLLAMGFLGPEATLAEALGIDLDPRSNFKVCCWPACWCVIAARDVQHLSVLCGTAHAVRMHLAGWDSGGICTGRSLVCGGYRGLV